MNSWIISLRSKSSMKIQVKHMQHIFVFFLFCKQTYVQYLQGMHLAYVEGQLGVEISALGAKWKSQLCAFPPATLEHSLESLTLGVRVKKSNSSSSCMSLGTNHFINNVDIWVWWPDKSPFILSPPPNKERIIMCPWILSLGHTSSTAVIVRGFSWGKLAMRVY